MSRTLARALHAAARVATAAMRPARRAATLALLHEATLQEVRVPTSAGIVRVVCPSSRALHDPYGFGRDEPETVAWIESLPTDAILWDIGANIGLYALFAAKRGVRVLAFEPSAASFAALVASAELNGLDRRIDAYCLALAEAPGLARLEMASSAAGHSMHSIAGGPARFSQAVPAISIDRLIADFGAPPPSHIKLDVDGIEAAILRGGRGALAGVREVLVEVEGEAAASEIPAILSEAGLRQIYSGLRETDAGLRPPDIKLLQTGLGLRQTQPTSQPAGLGLPEADPELRPMGPPTRNRLYGRSDRI